jgi:predicted glycosyltransferase
MIIAITDAQSWNHRLLMFIGPPVPADTGHRLNHASTDLAAVVTTSRATARRLDGAPLCLSMA